MDGRVRAGAGRRGRSGRVREANRLVTLWETDPENGNRPIEAAPANFLDWREQATSFEHVAALQPYSVDLTGADEPEVLYGWMVTEGFFEALARSCPTSTGRAAASSSSGRPTRPTATSWSPGSSPTSR